MQEKIIDISRTLSPEIAVWPGDTRFQLQNTMTRKSGESVNLTTITMSAHTGTHADAPFHFTDDGKTIDEVDLQPYWGLAQVVTVSKEAGPLYLADFTGYELSLASRLLVRTPIGSLPATHFPDLIPYPSPELAEELGRIGIRLYGTDTPSMDDIQSAALPGHRALLRNQIAILESLDLGNVPDGLYELSAIPLKIKGGDGSPVRAVLRTLTKTDSP